MVGSVRWTVYRLAAHHEGGNVMSRLILGTIAAIVLGVIAGVVFLAASGDDLGPIVVPTLTADTSTSMTATPTGTGAQAYAPTITPASTDIVTPAPTLTSTPTATATPTPTILNREDVFPGIVRINTFSGLFCMNSAYGTGFILDDYGRIGTAKHVAEKAGDICGMTATLYDGRTISARKLWMHTYADVAVIQLKQARATDPLPRGSSRAVQVGDPVYTVSYPGGMQYPPVLSVGTLTGRGPCREVSDGLLFDADVLPGYSGGPLLDSAGRVVGVITGSWSGFWVGPGSCATPIEHLGY